MWNLSGVVTTVCHCCLRPLSLCITGLNCVTNNFSIAKTILYLRSFHLYIIDSSNNCLIVRSFKTWIQINWTVRSCPQADFKTDSYCTPTLSPFCLIKEKKLTIMYAQYDFSNKKIKINLLKAVLCWEVHSVEWPVLGCCCCVVAGISQWEVYTELKQDQEPTSSKHSMRRPLVLVTVCPLWSSY